jgi:hypothetical protein
MDLKFGAWLGGIYKTGSTFGNYLDIGQGLVFQTIPRRQIAQIMIGQCNISTAFLPQISTVEYACENMLYYYQV